MIWHQRALKITEVSHCTLKSISPCGNNPWKQLSRALKDVETPQKSEERSSSFHPDKSPVWSKSYALMISLGRKTWKLRGLETPDRIPRGFRQKHSSWLRMQRTPSSPALRSSGPLWAKARTGPACYAAQEVCEVNLWSVHSIHPLQKQHCLPNLSILVGASEITHVFFFESNISVTRLRCNTAPYLFCSNIM